MLTIQQKARQNLEKHPLVPQRYGTAFHLTPPWTNVYDIPAELFKSVVTESNLDIQPLAKEAEYFEPAESDAYLNWHLINSEQLGLETIRVPTGTSQELQWNTEANQLQSRVIWIVIQEGAQLSIHDLAQDQTAMIRRLTIVQHAHSQLSYWSVRSSNTFVTEQMKVHLIGPEAKTEVTHLAVGRAKEQADMAVSVYHEAPDTTSRMTMRAAGYDQAITMYRGLIDVAQTARGTEGYQQGRALLLSPQTVVDLLPELAINTNDVRCSHGVSTLHLDDLSLFYLRSRGLSEQQARQLAITGFFHQGLHIPDHLANALESAWTAA